MKKQTQLFKGDTREENVILEFLSKNGTTSSDVIIKQTKLSASEFNQAITMLELKGLVLNNGGEKWSLK